MLSTLLICSLIPALSPLAQLLHRYLVHDRSSAACLGCFLCLQPGSD